MMNIFKDNRKILFVISVTNVALLMRWRSKESSLAGVVIYVPLLSQWHDGAMDSDRVKLLVVLFELHWQCGSVKNVAVFKSRMS